MIDANFAWPGRQLESLDRIEADDKFFELFEPGPCCVCGEIGRHRNVVSLDIKAPNPEKGWGCFVCGIDGGAVAVVCDTCIESETVNITQVCLGYPSEAGRMLIDESFEPFAGHIEKTHVWFDRYQEIVGAYIELIARLKLKGLTVDDLPPIAVEQEGET